MTGPRFVVLEHVHQGVHWDLMLERGDVLATWSVGSPIVPGRDLAAARLADHRLAYLDYEGPVSGDRGVVRRVAAGRYRVRQWDGDTVSVTLVGDQLSGELELSRAGGAAGWALRLLGKVD